MSAAFVIGALSVFYTFLSVSLFVPVIAGLHSRRPGTPEALAAIAGGVITVLAARVAGITGGAAWYATWLGIFASATIFAIVSAVRGWRRARARSE